MTDATMRPLDFHRSTETEMLRRSAEFLARVDRRRSVRDFSPDPVPVEIIENAVRAAGTAPSGANQQPWTFACISNPETKRQIRLAAEEEERAFYSGRAGEEWLSALSHLGTDWRKSFLETAPWLVAIFGQRWGTDAEGRKVKHYYVPESVGIATGLLITSLHMSGLATLTHTPSPMAFLNRICGRPENEKPYILLVVGYPVDGAVVPDIARKPLDAISVWI
ncbi:MAG TPA: nitroreductase family protein [Hyphomicrobiaceae bacterium]|nr:nitroreductase family protein [Hyphomicrobiaceae bacterium]